MPPAGGRLARPLVLQLLHPPSPQQQGRGGVGGGLAGGGEGRAGRRAGRRGGEDWPTGPQPGSGPRPAASSAQGDLSARPWLFSWAVTVTDFVNK